MLNKIKNIFNQKSKRTFVVAEMSANHSSNIKNAFKIVDQAKIIGVDAIKIQLYKANRITINSNKKDFEIKSKSWKKFKNLYNLYKKAETPYEWYETLKRYCKKRNIILFSSVFDLDTVDFLEKKNCPIYKIASPEIEDLNLIEKIAKTKKPIIISTGIANEKNIINALNVCKKQKNFRIILLNCISSYPAKNNELNLKYINILKKYCPLVGYSDHSNSDMASIISVASGAKVIEKHFKLNNKIKTPDSSFSYDPIQFKNLIKKIRETELMMGSENINKRNILKKKLKTVTRSIFYSNNINRGEKISLKNIKSVRPGTGLKLKYFNKILGKRVRKNCKFGHPVKLKDIIF